MPTTKENLLARAFPDGRFQQEAATTALPAELARKGLVAAGRHDLRRRHTDNAHRMTFLNPLFLLGLVAAGIPLLIHLFNFRKPRKVDFSSLAFLREVQRSTMQRVRIKQWLLLLLRTLAIAALVLAFARPILRGSLAGFIGGSGASSVVIALDASPSMQLRDARGAYFDQALRAAEAIARTTDTQDDVMVLVLGDDVPGAFGPGGGSAISRVADAELGFSTRMISAGMDAALDRLETATHPSREVYLISDMQATTLTDSLFAPSPSSSAVFAVPIGSGSSGNIAVTDVRVISRIVEVDQPITVEATLVNHGDTPAAAYSASAYLEGQRVAQVTTDLSPHTTTTVQFVMTPSGQGWLSGYVELEDDAFPGDNRHYFTFYTPETRRVLLVRGLGSSVSVISALLSDQLSGGRSRFDLTTIDESLLAAHELGAFDVVVLAGPSTLSSGEVNRLRDFIGAGGGVLWFPGPQMTVADYNALLSAVGGGTTAGLTPDETTEIIDVVDRVDTQHPLFDGVLASDGGGLERPEVYRRMRYRPGGATERSVMQLASGEPFLQEIRFGRGTVLLLTVAATPAWSDLTSRGLVVPLMFRSVFLLSATETVDGEQYAAGTGGDLLLPGISETSRVVFRSPSSIESVPEGRRVVGGLLLDLRGQLPEPGVYELRVGEQIVRKVAANLDPRESDLRRADAEELVARLSGSGGPEVRVLPIDGTNPDAARATLSAARRGIELWNVFMALALLCLVAEMIVAKRWRPESAM